MNPPEGWPTREMIAAGKRAIEKHRRDQDQSLNNLAEWVFRYMLAAAPTPPVPVLQLETQLSDRDVKALHDYLVQVATLPAQEITEDALEAAYWEFDARQKQYGEHKGISRTERDNFKWAVRKFIQTPPAQEVAYHGETSNPVDDHKAENVSNKSPAQEDEPICPRPANLKPDSTTMVECILAGECGCTVKGHEYAQAKAQKDEPFAWHYKSPRGQCISFGREESKYLADDEIETPLYTRPQSDELWKAAEEVVRSFDNYMQQESRLVELIASIENLRAALERP